LNLRKL